MTSTTKRLPTYASNKAVYALNTQRIAALPRNPTRQRAINKPANKNQEIKAKMVLWSNTRGLPNNVCEKSNPEKTVNVSNAKPT